MVIVSGVGIEKADEGENLRLTIQMIIPAQLDESKGGKAAGTQGPFFIRTFTGRTVSEAVERFQSETGRNVLWSHTKVIILAEELAQKGVFSALQYFERSAKFREKLVIFVAHGTTAKAILEAGHEVEKLSANAMELAVKMGRTRGTTPGIDFFQFITNLADPSLSPVANGVKLLPPLTVSGGEKQQPRINVSGTAVFKGDRMVGWLDPVETRGLMWLQNKVSKGVLVVNSPVEAGKQVGLRITGSKSKIYPEISRDRLCFKVKVKVETSVADQEYQGDLDNPAYLKKMEKELAQTVSEEIMSVIEKLQDWRTDPVGFGRTVKLSYTGQWRELRQGWQDKVFPANLVNVEVTANIKQTGTVFKSKMR